MSAAGEPRTGRVAPDVVAELPDLRLRWTTVAARPGPSPQPVRARLRALSDRSRGIDVVALRTRPVPRAFRACFRQLGLDPDIDRIPAERVAVRRLLDGGLRSGGRIADACLLAVVETAVGVWALDAAAVGPGGPAVCVGRHEGARTTPGGLVVADESTVHAPLFGDVLAGSRPDPRTRSVVLFAIGVAGVPEIHVHEALWVAGDALAGG
jgi:DNA/RNA-binding domain of Phe-tRNA-synthetase-like protein